MSAAKPPPAGLVRQRESFLPGSVAKPQPSEPLEVALDIWKTFDESTSPPAPLDESAQSPSALWSAWSPGCRGTSTEPTAWPDITKGGGGELFHFAPEFAAERNVSDAGSMPKAPESPAVFGEKAVPDFAGANLCGVSPGRAADQAPVIACSPVSAVLGPLAAGVKKLNWAPSKTQARAMVIMSSVSNENWDPNHWECYEAIESGLKSLEGGLSAQARRKILGQLLSQVNRFERLQNAKRS